MENLILDDDSIFAPISLDNEFTKYAINRSGTLVVNLKTKKILKTRIDKDGYYVISLNHKGRKFYKGVHRLVMEAFAPIKNMNEMEVNHMDGIKTNNHISNLEWLTPQDNVIHALLTGLHEGVKGNKNNFTKYSDELIHELCKLRC